MISIKAILKTSNKGLTSYPIIVNSRKVGGIDSNLKDVLVDKITKHQDKVKQFRKTHGSVVVGDVTINTIYGGMRGIKGLIWETSELNPEEGIRFRGYSIPECYKVLPKAKNGTEPLPEGIFWLLLTGDVPTESQVAAVSGDWASRGALPPHVAAMIKNFPKTLHPMSQFSAAITALNCDSNFVQAYSQGKLKKTNYWEYVFEDAMNLIAKLPVIAAHIYCIKYKDEQGSGVIDPAKDWSANFSSMMGFDNPEFVELMRMFLTIHCDHEGGNVSAHAVHLVGSALSDPYLAFAAGMNGLAGPLHGRANQDVLIFLKKTIKELGNDFTDEQLKEFVWKTLKSGQVIPGFGHAVLRVTDPRYISLREFALKHLPNDPLVKLTAKMFKVVPEVLKETGKVQNPWPNVDAHSGILLQYYGMKEMEFYTVIFGVSRSLGTMASLVWSRALGFPIERPKSNSTENLIKSFKAA